MNVKSESERLLISGLLSNSPSMYSKSQLALKYLKYLLASSNGKGHGMHSPFVFEFITKVMNDKKDYPEYVWGEGLRGKYLTDYEILNVEDFGAGSAVSKTNQRTARSIAKNAAKPKKYGQLLFRIVRYYKPSTIIELGTSMGVTSLYLSIANPDGQVTTIEGSAEVAAFAKKHLDIFQPLSLKLITGNFDDVLPAVLKGMNNIDFAFIDGNHRREPTERYFQMLLAKTNNDSILIFDDIHWSHEMEDAWEAIKNHPDVRCTIDLFFIGIVFFRQEFREKQHFNIRF